MQYLYIKGNDELFVLFHGTGGNENNLLKITEQLNPYASVLSFEGNVGSGINRRFFAPLVAGHVDREELDFRVDNFLKLWETLAEVRSAKKITFIGYSNGANFILALLEKYPDIAHRTFLLHASDLGWNLKKKTSKNELIFTLGAKDYIAPAGKIVQLTKKINDIFPNITTLLLDGGHEVDDEELNKLEQLYLDNKQHK